MFQDKIDKYKRDKNILDQKKIRKINISNFYHLEIKKINSMSPLSYLFVILLS